MDTNTDGLALRKLETELAYYKVKLTKFEEDNERLKADLQKSHEANKSLETDLEIYETRIEELEKVNKELQKVNVEYSKKLKLGKKENGDEATKELAESNDKRVKAAYKDGYGTAVSKMSAYLQEMKFDAVVTTEQKSTNLKVEQESREDEFEKALVENFGNCYFRVHNEDLLDKKLAIASALSKTYKVSPASVIKYLSKITRNIKPGNYTTVLSNTSEYICRTLADHIHEKQIGYDWGFIK